MLATKHLDAHFAEQIFLLSEIMKKSMGWGKAPAAGRHDAQGGEPHSGCILVILLPSRGDSQVVAMHPSFINPQF